MGRLRRVWEKTKAKWFVLLVTTTAAIGFGAPAIVSAISSGGSAFQFYTEALKWGFKALKEYFQFVTELYRLTLSSL